MAGKKLNSGDSSDDPSQAHAASQRSATGAGHRKAASDRQQQGDSAEEHAGPVSQEGIAAATSGSPAADMEGGELPIVAVGASAGGLEAFTEFLKHLPSDTGMAFVFAQHLDPRAKSSLVEILSRTTDMPICEATDGLPLEPNHVYTMPAQMDLAILRGRLQLMPRPKGRNMHLPIDGFFRALAEDQGPRAIGIVLSGTGSDGSLGLKAIKAIGGIAMAQEASSAKHGGMPSSAIATGCVDHVLRPGDLAEQLTRIASHHRVAARKRPPDHPAIEPSAALDKIFLLLRGATGVDFSYYKQSTVGRRIRRRMTLHKLGSVEHYAKYLQQTPTEANALFEDLLINVTSFFREPEAFAAIAKIVFPRIVREQPPEKPIRVWVPGCSTGEEAYSLVFSLLEYLDENHLTRPIQVFATDVSDAAVERARAGRYPESSLADVSPERRRRFFVPANGGYQISKAVREMCVVAKHNVLRDPPFSQLDLLSCRNLLIYLGPVLQKKILPAFHYALKPTGFLLLGASETIGEHAELFSLVDRKCKPYAKKPARMRMSADFTTTAIAPPTESAKPEAPPVAWGGRDLERAADLAVLAQYAPNGVVINDQMESTNEELLAANEEIQSGNEELQSTNEALGV